jgi:hypothetical protein
MTRNRRLVLVGFLVAFGLAAVRVNAESIVTKRTVRGEPALSERDEQEELFNYHFRDLGLRYQTEFAKLETSAKVDGRRIPYSTPIYLESSGGLAAARSTTGTVLGKYDLAFNNGQSLAESYDRRRKQRTEVRRVGLFSRQRPHTYYDAESWEGYCSGFTASTIRHPEPVLPVDASTVGGRPGVVFQPSEIKTLLCAAYNRTRPDSYLFVAPASARDGGPNMGTFHLALANYIGQAGHAIGIDRTKGRVAWNNPIYQYEVTSIRDAGQRGDIQYKDLTTRITYTGYATSHVNQTNRGDGRAARSPEPGDVDPLLSGTGRRRPYRRRTRAQSRRAFPLDPVVCRARHPGSDFAGQSPPRRAKNPGAGTRVGVAGHPGPVRSRRDRQDDRSSDRDPCRSPTHTPGGRARGSRGRPGPVGREEVDSHCN